MPGPKKNFKAKNAKGTITSSILQGALQASRYEAQTDDCQNHKNKSSEPRRLSEAALCAFRHQELLCALGQYRTK